MKYFLKTFLWKKITIIDFLTVFYIYHKSDTPIKTFLMLSINQFP